MKDLSEQTLELGDVLFSVVNAARFIGVDPEEALSQTISKFVRRFSYVEERLHEAGKTPGTSSLVEMDNLWEEAKENERR